MNAVALLLCCLGTQAATAQRLDRIVAVVDREVITESQMQVELRVALVWRAGEQAARALVQQPPATAEGKAQAELQAALQDYVVDQYLLAAQVRRQGDQDVPATAVAARLEQFYGRFADNAAYAAFLHDMGITPRQLHQLAQRDVRNDHFVQLRLRAHRALGGTADAEAASHKALRSWLAQLRRHTEIRRLVPGGGLEVQQPL